MAAASYHRAFSRQARFVLRHNTAQKLNLAATFPEIHNHFLLINSSQVKRAKDTSQGRTWGHTQDTRPHLQKNNYTKNTTTAQLVLFFACRSSAGLATENNCTELSEDVCESI